jgi:hypothetical protein
MNVFALKSDNPWARISEVAARLGVPPHVPKGEFTIVAKGADGNDYDVWEVVIAMLDKMDARA